MTQFIHLITGALFIKGMFLMPAYSMEDVDMDYAVEDFFERQEGILIPQKYKPSEGDDETYSPEDPSTDRESLGSTSRAVENSAYPSPGTSPNSVPYFWLMYAQSLKEEEAADKAREKRVAEREKSIILAAAENILRALNDEEVREVDVVKKEGGGEMVMTQLASPNSPKPNVYKRMRALSKEEVQFKMEQEKEAIFKAVEGLMCSRGEQELWDDLEKIRKGTILPSSLLPSVSISGGRVGNEEKKQLRRRRVILQTIRDAISALYGEERKNVSIFKIEGGGRMLVIHTRAPESPTSPKSLFSVEAGVSDHPYDENSD
jgi:hypothetical protein